MDYVLFNEIAIVTKAVCPAKVRLCYTFPTLTDERVFR